MSNVLKRLEKIEGSFQTHALVLRLKDGRKKYLPVLAMIDTFLGFSTLVHEGSLSWRDKPIPQEWIESFAASVPEPGEGMLVESCRELSRRYLNGEDLSV